MAQRYGALRLVAGSAPSALYELRGRTIIGRAADCEVVVQDQDVSRHHCEIEFEAHEFVLRDRDSSNGTYLNGSRVNSVALRHGDTITVGSTRFVFQRWALPRNVADSTVVASFRLALGAPPFDAVSAESPPEQISRALQKYKLLYRTNEIISRCTEPSFLFNLVLEQLFEVLSCDLGMVLIGNRPMAVEIASVLGSRTAPEGALSRTVLERVLVGREAMLVSDVQLDDRFHTVDSLITAGTQSLLCAPICYGDQVLGALQIESHTKGNAFDRDDLEVLAAIARQTGLALHNAQLLQREAAPAVSKDAPTTIVRKPGAGPARGEVTVLRLNLSPPATEEPTVVLSRLETALVTAMAIVGRWLGLIDSQDGAGLTAFWLDSPQGDRLAAARCGWELTHSQELPVEWRLTVGLDRDVAVIGELNGVRRVVGPIKGNAARLAENATDREVALSQRLLAHLGAALHSEPVGPPSRNAASHFRMIGLA